jgi:DNA-directed RNA polymerase specialized sigma24 family protein
MIALPPKKRTEKKQVEPLAVSSKDAATMLGVSERTVFNLARDGKITCKKIGWRSLYLVASIKAFLETSDNE